MAYLAALPEDERHALETGFREHLAGTVPGIVSKRFAGGETWCADPLMRAEALAYLKAMRPDFEAIGRESLEDCTGTEAN